MHLLHWFLSDQYNQFTQKHITECTNKDTIQSSTTDKMDIVAIGSFDKKIFILVSLMWDRKKRKSIISFFKAHNPRSQPLNPFPNASSKDVG